MVLGRLEDKDTELVSLRASGTGSMCPGESDSWKTNQQVLPFAPPPCEAGGMSILSPQPSRGHSCCDFSGPASPSS